MLALGLPREHIRVWKMLGLTSSFQLQVCTSFVLPDGQTHLLSPKLPFLEVLIMMGGSSLVGGVALLTQVFREWHVLGDRSDFIQGDRPKPVLPNGPSTKFSASESFLPFIDPFNRFNNVPLHG